MAGKDDKEKDTGKKDKEKSDAKKDGEGEEDTAVKITDAKYILYPVKTFFDMTSGEKDAIVDFKKLDAKIRKSWAKSFAEDLSMSANDKFAGLAIEVEDGKKKAKKTFFFQPDVKKWVEKKGKSKPEELDKIFENDGWKMLGAKLKEQIDAFIARLPDIDKLIESAEMMAVNENDYEKVKSFLNDAMFLNALTAFKH